ncbi:MAG: transketolase, partial [Fimbriimonadaceae bacterium]|nr:transketolase [Fimbriimonadaceae bacterium]
PEGRNLCFGVREHAMACAVNGMNLHGGLRAYGATFLIFSDYCRPAIRLAALMHCPSLFVFTHDSVGLGEDGPTHQPIEQLSSLRAMPNLFVFRPADGNETAACWLEALRRSAGPSCLVLTRQGVPAISSEDIERHPARSGAYVLHEPELPAMVTLLATGSEVAPCLEAARILADRGRGARVVSMPCCELFEEQDREYRESVLPPEIPTLSVEAGATWGWSKYAQAHVGIDRFGASAPGDVVMRELGIEPESIARKAESLLTPEGAIR